MNKNNLYKSLINDISDIVKKCINEALNDKIIYDPDTKFKLNLSDIPIELLRKQYINYKFILLPDIYGEYARHERVNESLRYTIPAEMVLKIIKRKYNLYDWQCQVITAYNNVRVIAVIPLLDENEKLITDSMKLLGYVKSCKWEQNVEGMTYMAIRFDPVYSDTLTNKIRSGGYIFHWSPAYNLDSIKQNGFIPKSENTLYNYPPRVHFVKGQVPIEEMDNIGRLICNANDNPKNNGDYILFGIDVSKIPDDIEFYADPCYEWGVYTYDPIPYDAVSYISEKQFNK